VRLKETSMSRVQARIDFIDNKWIFRDGNGPSKPSTNGCWLFLREAKELKDGDLFKAGNMILRVEYIH